MALPATGTHSWTVEILDALPDDGQRYEIIDGELFMTPSPVEVHQMLLANCISGFASTWAQAGASDGHLLFRCSLRRSQARRVQLQRVRAS